MSSLNFNSGSPEFFICLPVCSPASIRSQKISLWKESHFLTESVSALDLKLDSKSLNDDDINTIYWLLKDSPKPLRSLHVRCCTNASKELFDTIGEILKTNTSLVDLQLEPSLKDLYQLNNRTASDSGRGIVIAEALKTNKTLTTFLFFGHGIQTESAGLFAEAFRSNQSLTEINLGGQPLGGKGFQTLIESLQYHPSLTILNLNDINLGRESYSKENCEPLLQLLQHHTSLTELRLGRSWLPVEASLGIATSLLTNTTLQLLNYQENSFSVTAEVGKAFVEVLQQNSTLKSLDLSWTDMGPHVAVEIAQALPFNTSLTELTLTNNNHFPTDLINPTPNVYAAFSEQIPLNYSVCKLGIGIPGQYQYWFAQEAMEIIARCTERNKDLVAKRTNTLFQLLLPAIYDDYSVPEASSSTVR